MTNIISVNNLKRYKVDELWTNLKKYYANNKEIQRMLVQLFLVLCGARKAYYKDDDVPVSEESIALLKVLNKLLNIDYIIINKNLLVYNVEHVNEIKQYLSSPNSIDVLGNLLGFHCQFPSKLTQESKKFTINIYVLSSSSIYYITSFLCTIEDPITIMIDLKKRYQKALNVFDKNAESIIVLSRPSLIDGKYQKKIRTTQMGFKITEYRPSKKYVLDENNKLMKIDGILLDLFAV